MLLSSESIPQIAKVAEAFRPWGVRVAIAIDFASGAYSCIAPPAIVKRSATPRMGQIVRRTPAGRLGEPADIARVVQFLTSPENDYLTGQVIVVDGGLTA